MIEEILLNPERLARVLGIIFVVGIFIYIIILAFLQVRQIRILQDKIQTDADNAVKIFTYGYIIFQVILFVIAILFL